MIRHYVVRLHDAAQTNNRDMANKKTIHAYEIELRKLIKERTGEDCEPWIVPQIRSTAKNEFILDKVTEEITNGTLTQVSTGSAGQQKIDVSPLLPYFDKLNRTLIAQFEALGLNYNTTPSKVNEKTKRNGTDVDLMMGLMEDVRSVK